MMNEMQIKKMEELMADDAIFAKIQEAGSNEKTYEILAANGVECTAEEFEAYLEECRQVMKEKGLMDEDGELSLEALDTVSGGSKRGKTILLLAALALAGGGAYAAAGVALILACLH